MSTLLSAVLFLWPAQAYPPSDGVTNIQNLSLAAGDPIEFVGIWPYGRCEAAVIDSAGNIAVIGNGETLQVLDISNPSSPWKKGEVRLEGTPQDIALSGNLAYIATQSYLTIADISNRNAPRVTASIYMGGTILESLVFHTNHVFVAANNGLNVFDVSDPDQPLYRGRYQRNGMQLLDVAVWGTYAICLYAHWTFPDTASWTYGVEVIDVSDPENPKEVFNWMSSIKGSYAEHVVVRDDKAFVTGDLLRIFDLSNPARPSPIVFYGLRCESIALSGDFAYLAWDKLWAIDITNLFDPTAYHYRGEWGKGVAVSGNIIYIPGSLYVLKNNVVPALSLTAPAGSATLLGSVPIEVQASHSSGIDRVEFYIDGALIATDSSAPYAYPWDTTLEEDGLHMIRARAYNQNEKSADAQVEVFTRLVYAPLKFKAEMKLNRSLSQAEYLNALSWQVHPNNMNVAKYKLFQVEGTSPRLLAELSAETLKYWHRNVRTDQDYDYVLVAVNAANRESDPVYTTVRKEARPFSPHIDAEDHAYIEPEFMEWTCIFKNEQTK